MILSRLVVHCSVVFCLSCAVMLPVPACFSPTLCGSFFWLFRYGSPVYPGSVARKYSKDMQLCFPSFSAKSYTKHEHRGKSEDVGTMLRQHCSEYVRLTFSCRFVAMRALVLLANLLCLPSVSGQEETHREWICGTKQCPGQFHCYDFIFDHF